MVTVLFADLAGSTALGELLDPEDVRELQGELFELINTEVERFGGTTEKFAGDAVLAVFGIPQAHEDDPERAVRAALAVRDSFDTFTARVQGRHGADVGLRIGVNTGEVVAGREAASRGELMVSGDAVNWKVSITSPMPLTLEFIGKISGDSMSGEMGIGPMGSFPFTGTRV